MRETVLEAVLRSADAPSEVQRNRFAAFLKKQYGQEVPLRWEQDPALEKGFRLCLRRHALADKQWLGLRRPTLMPMHLSPSPCVSA